jgi:hypothetical protein
MSKYRYPPESGDYPPPISDDEVCGIYRLASLSEKERDRVDEVDIIETNDDIYNQHGSLAEYDSCIGRPSFFVSGEQLVIIRDGVTLADVYLNLSSLR